MKGTWIQRLRQVWQWVRWKSRARKADAMRRKQYVEALIVEINRTIEKYHSVDFGPELGKGYALSQKKWTKRQALCLLVPLPAIFLGVIAIVTTTSWFTMAVNEPGSLLLVYTAIWGGMSLLFSVAKTEGQHEVGHSQYYIKCLEADARQIALAIQLDENAQASKMASETKLDEGAGTLSTTNLIKGLLNMKCCTSDADLLYGLMLIYRRLLREGEQYNIKPRKKYCCWTHYEWWAGCIIVPLYATLLAVTIRAFVYVVLLRPLGVSSNWSWIAAVAVWVAAYVTAARDLGVRREVPLVSKPQAIDLLSHEIEMLARQITFAKEAERQHREKLMVAFRALKALITEQLQVSCMFHEKSDKPAIVVAVKDRGSWKEIYNDWCGKQTRFELTDEDCRELTQIVLTNLTMKSRGTAQQVTSLEYGSDQLVKRLEALKIAYENNGHVDDLLAGLLQ